MRNFISNLLLFVILLALFTAIALLALGQKELLTIAGLKKFFATGELGEYQVDLKHLVRSSTFVFSLIAGLVTGGITFIIGAVKNQLGIGFAGFLACIACGIVGGLLIAIPTTAIFTWWICREAEQDKRKLEQASHQYRDGRELHLFERSKP